MGIYAFAISIFFISWVMIFGICIDYRSAESIGIRIVLYLKCTLLTVLGLGGKKNLKYNEDLAKCVNLWSIRGIHFQ